jgi:membrane-associated protease RseP (regulator of RpoE activity)
MTPNIRLIGITLILAVSPASGQTLPCTRQTPDTSATNAHFIGKDAHLFMDTTRRSGNLDVSQAFGIFGLDVASFEESKFPDRPPVISFLAEPVVTLVAKTSLLKPGDVIEAIDDHPITSSVGSRQFTAPTPGANTLTVRRGRDRVILRFDVVAPPPCTDWTTPPSGVVDVRDAMGVQGRRGGSVNFDSTVGRGRRGGGNVTPPAVAVRASDSGRVRIRGVSKIRVLGDTTTRVPLYVIDGVKIEPSSVPPPSRYGFAVTCRTCAKVTTPDGTSFYKFETLPPISDVLPNSPAAIAGLKPGDVIVKVDGFSILEDDGAIRLSRSDNQSLSLTVLRETKEMVVQLQIPK